MTFDLLIKAGLIVDGTGGEPYQADVGISGDRVHAIGVEASRLAKAAHGKRLWRIAAASSRFAFGPSPDSPHAPE